MRDEVDIAVIGGGLNGTAVALALGSAGFEVAVLDAAPRVDREDDGFDGRATAIAAGSRNMLRQLGVWQRLEGKAQPIQGILVTDGRVSEGASPRFLHFDHREVGAEPFGNMVENRHLRRALMGAIDDSANDDTMTGRAGDDTFVFDDLSGTDRIADFGTGDDLLDMSAFNIDSRDDLDAANAISQVGSHVIIDYAAIDAGQDGQLYLLNTDLADVTNDDFVTV